MPSKMKELWEHFVRLPELGHVKKTKFHHIQCVYCKMAHEAAPDQVPKPEIFKGCRTLMEHHLCFCKCFWHHANSSKPIPNVTQRTDEDPLQQTKRPRGRTPKKRRVGPFRRHRSSSADPVNSYATAATAKSSSDAMTKETLRSSSTATSCIATPDHARSKDPTQPTQGRQAQEQVKPSAITAPAPRRTSARRAVTTPGYQPASLTEAPRVAPVPSPTRNSPPPTDAPSPPRVSPRVALRLAAPALHLQVASTEHESTNGAEQSSKRLRLDAAMRMTHTDVLWTDTSGDLALQTMMEFCLFLEKRLSTQNMAILRKLLVDFDQKLFNQVEECEHKALKTTSHSTLELFVEFPLHVIVIRPIGLPTVNPSAGRQLLHPRPHVDEVKSRGTQVFNTLERMLLTNNLTLLRRMFDEFCDGRDELVQRFVRLAIDVVSVVPLKLPVPRSKRHEAYAESEADEIEQPEQDSNEEDEDDDTSQSDSDGEYAPGRRGREPKRHYYRCPVVPLTDELAKELDRIRAQRPWETIYANLRCPFDLAEYENVGLVWKSFWEKNGEAVWERSFWSPCGEEMMTERKARQRSMFASFTTVMRHIARDIGLNVFIAVMRSRHEGWCYRPDRVDLRRLEQELGTCAVIHYVRTQAFARFPKLPNAGTEHDIPSSFHLDDVVWTSEKSAHRIAMAIKKELKAVNNER